MLKIPKPILAPPLPLTEEELNDELVFVPSSRLRLLTPQAIPAAQYDSSEVVSYKRIAE